MESSRVSSPLLESSRAAIWDFREEFSRVSERICGSTLLGVLLFALLRGLSRLEVLIGANALLLEVGMVDAEVVDGEGDGARDFLVNFIAFAKERCFSKVFCLLPEYQ